MFLFYDFLFAFEHNNFVTKYTANVPKKEHYNFSK